METIFLCALLAFLLFVLDRYRRENVGEPRLADALVKLVAIFIFGALSLSLFAWVRVRERQDPVVDDITDAQGVLILDDIVTVAFALLMVWVIALSIIALGVTHEHTSHIRRFRFLIVPSGVVTLSMLIAMFFRVYGPFNRDSEWSPSQVSVFLSAQHHRDAFSPNSDELHVLLHNVQPVRVVPGVRVLAHQSRLCHHAVVYLRILSLRCVG